MPKAFRLPSTVMLRHTEWHALGGSVMQSCAQQLVNCIYFHDQQYLLRAACAGTNNEELLRSPFYVGCKHQRVRGDAYYELIDELMSAVKRRCGRTPACLAKRAIAIMISEARMAASVWGT